MSRSDTDLEAIRLDVLRAVVGDDVLFERLVLKGGNALELVHRVVKRGSLDLDFSLARDFDDPEDIRIRLLASLTRTFAARRLRVVDYTFAPKPSVTREEWWGGYNAKFKLIPEDLASRFPQDVEKQRREAVVVGAKQERIFSIDISKHEYCDGSTVEQIDSVPIRVYTLQMIVAEKLRAICQQMEGYQQFAPCRVRKQRARDFFDIHAVLAKQPLNIGELSVTTKAVFAAKRVPVEFLRRIEQERSLHEPFWEGLVRTLAAPAVTFDEALETTRNLADGILKALEVG